MKLGIMQPYFFPYIGYWQLINWVDEYIVFDDVNYIKRGWINRNFILFNGQPKRINLYIKDASQNRLIKDTELAQTAEDNIVLLKNIKQGYAKAPYFYETYSLIEDILQYPTTNLAEYLMHQIEIICDYLGIKTKILRSSAIKKDMCLKGEEKIIDLCRKRGADTYINPIGGQYLYHQERFKKENIELSFLQANKICYKQFENSFVPYLSIIDVMMFNSMAEITDLLYAFELENSIM